MFNIRSVDLNLLPVLEAVYEEQSLSRAAVRLAMTQSAVSHAVTRLRTLFRDELFVRQPRGVLPTPTADLIYAKVRGGLGLVREAITELQGFDPKTSTRQFFVTIPHPMGPMIALRLRERLATIAPQINVAASTRSRPIDLDRALREGRTDAGSRLAEAARRPVLHDDAIRGLSGRRRPRRPSRLASSRVGENHARRQIRLLAPSRRGRRTRRPVSGNGSMQNPDVVLEVSEILEIFMVASQSDLFGVIPRSMEKVARNLFGLRPLRDATKAAPVPIWLIWHASREADPAHAFLRKELAAAATAIVQRG